jgi:hypothetical protein
VANNGRWGREDHEDITVVIADHIGLGFPAAFESEGALPVEPPFVAHLCEAIANQKGTKCHASWILYRVGDWTYSLL